MTVSNDKTFPDTAVFPYDRVLPAGKGTVKQGKVVGIEHAKGTEGGQIVFEDGEKLSYDVLVLATGSHWPGPLDFPDDKAEWKQFVDQWRDKFGAAKDVTLVGGGAIGVEFAGELRDEYPEKKITIIHAQPHLLNPAYPDKFRLRLENGLKKRNIELVLDEFVETFPESGSGELVLRSGKKIASDCVVHTGGPKPNTEFIAASLGDDVLSADKRIKVTPTLQLPTHPSIFAAGDIIDWNEQHQAAKTTGHAGVIVANVLSYIVDQPLTKEYKGSPEVIIVTNGKTGGAAFLPFLWGIVLGDWFARTIKSKGLLLGMAKSNMGY
jgi:NADH dehydrogenase FAD-containing subunit